MSDKKPIVTYISTPRIIHVEPGLLRGSLDRVVVDECILCGALLHREAVLKHLRWHEACGDEYPTGPIDA